jgi:hypothetical protein
MPEGSGLRVGSYVAFLLAVLGALAWATGTSLLLPSLGPSAYALASVDESPRRVVVGQLVGALAAFLAVLVVAPASGPFLGVDAQSAPGFRRIAAAVLATVAATLGMRASNATHAPAYATVLIVAMGIADRLIDVLAFAGGVFVLVGMHAFCKRLGPWNPPYAG